MARGVRETQGSEVRARIMHSARLEILKNGTTGLRVAEVAAGAGSSITQIYRHFRDRDGLIARVLGDMYEETLEQTTRAYVDSLAGVDPITVDDLVAHLPSPSSPEVRANQELRNQTLAALVTNADLRARIEEVTQAHVDLWNSELDSIERRMAPGQRFDRRVFTIMISQTTHQYVSLMGDKAFSDDEYRRFVRDKLIA